MAEGWLKHFSDCRVASAGIEAHGLNETAVTVMREVGVDISTQTSNTLEEVDIGQFDIVITVCGDALDRCPVLPSTIKKVHWPLQDPATFVGHKTARLDVFRKTRDDIKARVLNLLDL